jgi:ribonuclease D
MENYTYIDNIEKLIDFRKYLYEKNISKIAMDFEGEFNLHSYGEKLRLIQIYDGERYFVIDPLTIDDIEICKTLGNHKIVKFMYGIESDINLIYKQYGIKLTNIFDQKTLVDVLNFENKGLDDVVNLLFNVKNNYKTKYQKYNWQKRPIKNDAIIYALNDVKYLFKINEILLKRIIEENKVNDLILRIIKINFNFEKDRIPRIFKKKAFRELSENDKETFTKIYEVRDNYAKILNMPPHNIIENTVLFSIANLKTNLDKITFNKKISKEICLEILNKIRGIIKNKPNCA